MLVDVGEHGEELRFDHSKGEVVFELFLNSFPTICVEIRLLQQPPPQVLLVLQLYSVIGAALQSQSKPGEPC